mgnify:FL=1
MSDRLDKRFRHKLNMLEPGIVMLKIHAVLVACGTIFSLLEWKTVSIIAFGLAALLMLALLILLRIEQHQDRVLNELAQRENKEIS